MSNFDDFDLDLRQVSDDIEDPLQPRSTTTTIVMSLKNKCKSVDSPTTGGTGLCCKKNARAANSRCI